MTEIITCSDLTKWLGNSVNELNRIAGESDVPVFTKCKLTEAMKSHNADVFCYDMVMYEDRKQSFIDHITSLCRKFSLRVSKVDTRQTLLAKWIALPSGKTIPIDNNRRNKAIIHFTPKQKL